MRFYTEMVADLFHPGHVAFLRAARARCEHLTVGLLTDDVVRAGKGAARPVMRYEERRAMLESCRYVDRVVPVDALGVDATRLDALGCDRLVFAAADDAELRTKLGYFTALPPERMLVLPYTPGISTSGLIERIRRSA